MNSIIKDPLVVMDFPITEHDRSSVVRALLDRKHDVEQTFSRDECIVLDLTNQQLLGIKSTSTLTTKNGEVPLGDRIALNYVISSSEKYKGSKMFNLGNVSAIYNHYAT